MYDLSEFCHICFKTDLKLTTIESHDTTIIEKLNKLSFETAWLLKETVIKLCSKCLLDLDRLKTMKRICTRSNKKLRNYITMLKNNDTDSRSAILQVLIVNETRKQKPTRKRTKKLKRLEPTKQLPNITDDQKLLKKFNFKPCRVVLEQQNLHATVQTCAVGQPTPEPIPVKADPGSEASVPQAVTNGLDPVPESAHTNGNTPINYDSDSMNYESDALVIDDDVPDLIELRIPSPTTKSPSNHNPASQTPGFKQKINGFPSDLTGLQAEPKGASTSAAVPLKSDPLVPKSKLKGPKSKRKGLKSNTPESTLAKIQKGTKSKTNPSKSNESPPNSTTGTNLEPKPKRKERKIKPKLKENQIKRKFVLEIQLKGAKPQAEPVEDQSNKTRLKSPTIRPESGRKSNGLEPEMNQGPLRMETQPIEPSATIIQPSEGKSNGFGIETQPVEPSATVTQPSGGKSNGLGIETQPVEPSATVTQPSGSKSNGLCLKTQPVEPVSTVSQVAACKSNGFESNSEEIAALSFRSSTPTILQPKTELLPSELGSNADKTGVTTINHENQTFIGPILANWNKIMQNNLSSNLLQSLLVQPETCAQLAPPTALRLKPVNELTNGQTSIELSSDDEGMCEPEAVLMDSFNCEVILEEDEGNINRQCKLCYDVVTDPLCSYCHHCNLRLGLHRTCKSCGVVFDSHLEPEDLCADCKDRNLFGKYYSHCIICCRTYKNESTVFKPNTICLEFCSRNGSDSIENLTLYDCKVCKFQFLYESDKIKHQIEHDERKFSCYICCKLFRENDRLIRHYRRHTEFPQRDQPVVKPKAAEVVRPPRAMVPEGEVLQCAYCQKIFKTKRTLRDHTEIHTGVMEECEFCHKSYLKRFMKKHWMRGKCRIPFEQKEQALLLQAASMPTPSTSSLPGIPPLPPLTAAPNPPPLFFHTAPVPQPLSLTATLLPKPPSLTPAPILLPPLTPISCPTTQPPLIIN